MKPVQLGFERAQASAVHSFMGPHPSRLSIAALAVLVAALAACGHSLWRAFEAGRELDAARNTLQLLQRRAGQTAQAANGTRVHLSAQQRQAWSQITRQLNTPWPALLDALEAHTPDDVALVSIEPDARRGSVRLQAEAKDLETLLNYAGQLGAAAAFESVTLLKHETNEQDANKPLRLSLDIRLRTTATEVPR